MAVYTVYPTALTGDSKAYVTPASGDTFPNDGRTILHVKNANGANCVVTVTATKPCDVAGTLHTNVVTVALTTGDEMIGPFPVGVWGGTVTVTTYSVTASVSVAAISMP
jgi:hypothetical protein